ncbi:MAG: aminotransferase class V-fold PLP-dependent enzyme, partial [Acidobacteria bacterium]|nr:aminotransferase class V-fold PLP-dependent enzyme [Acidobacteriota bacterium]
MRYLSTSSEQQALMLKALGMQSIEDLLTSIPEAIRLRSPLDLPPALSEPELLARFAELEGGNEPGMLSFLGAGVNQHFIPLVIDSLCSRGEFLTSYTPYQAEISQGTLQAVFEFQTFICQLTGMEISNASMYDGSSALAEAVLMARRISRRGRVLVARTVHPEYRAVVETVTQHQDLTIQTVDHGEDGRLDAAELEARLGGDVGALVVQSPNFLGNLESLDILADLCRQKGVLLVVNVAELLSLGIVRSPGSAGADIVCGEAQS